MSSYGNDDSENAFLNQNQYDSISMENFLMPWSSSNKDYFSFDNKEPRLDTYENYFYDIKNTTASFKQFPNPIHSNGTPPFENDLLSQPLNLENLNTVTNSGLTHIYVPEIKYSFRIYGSWLNRNERYFNKYEEINSIKNGFINQNEYIIQDVLLFSDDVPKFLDREMLIIKDIVFQYSRRLINYKIKNIGYQLKDVDYENFIKIIKRESNLNMMTEKIGVLFSENQTNNYDALKGHNKNVIEYIKENSKKESEANDLINLNFLEMLDKFKSDAINGLDIVLEQMENLVKKILAEKQKSLRVANLLIEEKIQALKNIFRLLCEEFENYFKLKAIRKKKNNSKKGYNKITL